MSGTLCKSSVNDVFDVVIVHKLDRFSRNKYNSAQYKRKLKQNGVKLISVNENLRVVQNQLFLKVLLKK